MPGRLVVWLCRTPQRLAATAVAVLVVVLVVAGVLSGAGPARPGGGSSGPTAAPAALPTAAQLPDAARFVSIAVRFTQAWAVPPEGGDAGQWQARLAPLATTTFAEELGSTDPAGLPGVGVQGEPVVRFLALSSALVAVPLADGSSVLVSVVDESGTVKVSNLQPNVGD